MSLNSAVAMENSVVVVGFHTLCDMEMAADIKYDRSGFMASLYSSRSVIDKFAKVVQI